jgi:hypothetical protein
MKNYTYEIIGLKDGYGVKIYEDSQLHTEQYINPDTNIPFKSEEEAKEWANSFIAHLIRGELSNQPPILEIQFRDLNDNLVDVVKVDQEVKVHVELYQQAGNEKIYVPVSGTYVVPYFVTNSNTLVGTVLIDIANGVGEKIIKMKQSGIFEIKLDRVLNKETMQPPDPLPVLKQNPKLIVVDE